MADKHAPSQRVVLREPLLRGIRLFVVAEILTVAVGYTAFATDVLYNRLTIPNWSFNLAMVLAFAATVGLVVGPIVACCLLKKNAFAGFGVIYVPAALVGCATSMFAFSYVAAIPVALTILLLSPVACTVLPDRYELQKNRRVCRYCKYDLSGAAHERCPECGAAVRIQKA